MYKSFIVAAALTSLMASGASATPLGEFDGNFDVTKISAGCGGYPGPHTPGILMRFLPPGVGGNGTATRIVLRDYSLVGAMDNYWLDSGTLVGTTLVPVNFVFAYIQSGAGMAKAQISSQNPPTIDDTTHIVKLVGKIAGFRGNSTCTVNFAATLYSY